MEAPARLNTVVLLSTAVASLGGLLFGFDTAVIAGTTSALTTYFHLSDATLGVTVSCALWGTVLGGLLAFIPAEKLGGRESLRVTSVLYLISAAGCSLAHAWYPFLLFRFIGGMAIGGCSVFAPMYIAEIAPTAIRGKLVGCFQLSIVGGILAAYASNFAIGHLTIGFAEWRADLGVAAVPSILFFAALSLIPRSPRWLILNGRFEEASRALTILGFNDAQAQSQEIKATVTGTGAGHSASVFSKAHRKPLLLALLLGFFNQMSGINAVLYYLNDIFARAGFAAVSSQRQAVIVGIANLVFTMLGMALIDRIGRKPLLMAGAAGMAVALALIAVVFFTGRHQLYLLPLLVAFIACFAASQGAVVWVYMSEVFPPAVRSSGQGFSTFWLWLLTAIVAGIFPTLAHTSSGAPFLLFSSCMILQFIAVMLFFPETRGKDLYGIAVQQ